MRITYGYEKQDDKLVALVIKVMEAAGLACAPSHFWVNMMPWRMSLYPAQSYAFLSKITDVFSSIRTCLGTRRWVPADRRGMETGYDDHSQPAVRIREDGHGEIVFSFKIVDRHD